MARKALTETQKKQKELVQQMLVAKGPNMMSKCLNFIEKHFDDEDKDYRRDAHKLFGKWFDSQIPKTQIMQVQNEKPIMDPRFEKFLDTITLQSAKEIEADFDKISGMVEGHRQMSDSEFSYTLTGSGDSLRLSKINHPGVQARDLNARMGNISDDHLVRKLRANGIETREDEPAEPAQAEPPATPAPAEPAPADHPMQITVAGGMFGG